MTSRLNPYLSFKNNAREAMAFYHSVFGGELTTSTFGEGGMAHDPKENDLIMTGSSDYHGSGKSDDFRLGANTTDPAEFEKLLG